MLNNIVVKSFYMLVVRSIKLMDLLSGERCINFSLLDLFQWKEWYQEEVCRCDFYQLVLLEEGELEYVIDFSAYSVHAPAASIVFPQQLGRVALPEGAKGTVIVFDETVFCSEVMATELKDYNVDLHRRLNCVSFEENPIEFGRMREWGAHLKELYADLNVTRKMQIKFMIKVLILKLLDQSSSALPVVGDRDIAYYVRFRELVDRYYESERKLDFYSSQLGISSKKLSSLCALYSGLSPLGIIHERLVLELKKCFLSESLTLKEIAFRFGFSSQSALNKFIDSKFRMTPSALKEYLLEVATGRQRG